MEDKHAQMHFIMIKTRGVYNQALMLRHSFGRFVSKHVCHTFMNKGPRSHYVFNTHKQSHFALFSQSYDCFFSMLTFQLSVQLAHQWKMAIFKRKGGGLDPYNSGRKALSLGRFPHKVETRGQRRKAVVI